MTHPILQVLNSSPINREAKRVTSQRHCVDVDTDLDRVQLQNLVARLERKMRLMKRVLHITTHRQHKNVVARFKRNARQARPSRIVNEYVQAGQAIQILVVRLAELKPLAKKDRQRVGAMESKWRAEHPGCIWDGRQLVAPTGETFSRYLAAVQVQP